MTRFLHILTIGASEGVERCAALLTQRGHSVESVAVAELIDGEERRFDQDVLLIEVRDRDPSGIDLLARLRAHGIETPVVLAGNASFADCRRAVELEATDFVMDPQACSDLVAAVERAGYAPGVHSAATVQRRYAATDGSVERAVREVSALLMRHGVQPAHRMRIASATAEIADNARRHGAGDFLVRAGLEGSSVQTVVEDSGPGFDVPAELLNGVPSLLPGSRRCSSGLYRARALSEELSIASGATGTRVELRFELTPVRFDEEPEDFSEIDYLDPESAQSLVSALRDGGRGLANVTPSLALTIGRLLGGMDDANEEVNAPRRSSVG